jgi:hypothetical protein
VLTVATVADVVVPIKVISPTELTLMETTSPRPLEPTNTNCVVVLAGNAARLK